MFWPFKKPKATPVAKTIPEEWKQPIADVTADKLNQIDAQLAHLTSLVRELQKPTPATLKPKPAAAPVIATDRTVEGLLALMRR